MTQLFGQLNPLYDAVRVRAPEVEAACVHRNDAAWADAEGGAEGGEPSLYMRVSYGPKGPFRVLWDNDLREYLWGNGPDVGVRLGGDADLAADRIAQALGAPSGPADGDEST